MSDIIDTILQLRPVLRLILFSLVLSLVVSALVARRWKNQPRCRSFALIGAFVVLMSASLLTILCSEANIGWRIPASAVEFEPAPAPVPLSGPLFDGLSGTAIVSTQVDQANTGPGYPDFLAIFWSALNWFIELWLIGTVLLLFSLPFRFLLLKRALAQTRAPNPREQARLNGAQPFQNQQPEIRISPFDVVPFFSGLLRTCIVIPQRLLKDCSDDELQMVIGHEQAHANHRDQWVALLQQLTIALHWWNPLIWKLSRQLTISREMLCDRMVTREKSEDFVERYRELLVTLTETLSHRAPRANAFALAATSCFEHLRERLVLLSRSASASDRRPSRVLVSAMALLAVSALLISSCDSGPRESAQPIELSEIDLKIQNGEITFDSFFSQLSEPEIDPAMTTPGRDVFIKTRFVEDEGPALTVEQSTNEPYIYITTKFIETENEIDEKLPGYTILSGEQFEVLVRMLNMERGADLLSAPSVMAKNTQAAKIEVGRKLPLPTPPKFDQDDTEQNADAFVETGVSLEVTPTIKQGQIFLVGKAIVREPDGPESKLKTAAVQGVLSFNTVETYFSAPVKPGSTLLLNCRQHNRQKGSLLITVTASIKGANGADLDPK